MVKRIVVAVAGAARGYVDGRFVGEEKDGEGARGRGRKGRSAGADSVLGAAGIAVARKKPRGQGKGNGQGQGKGQGQGQGKGRGQGKVAGQGQSRGGGTGRTGRTAGQQGQGQAQGQGGQGQGGQGQGGQGRAQGQRRAQGQAVGTQAAGQRRPRAQGAGQGQGQGQQRGQGQRQSRGPRGGVAGERVLADGNAVPNVIAGELGGEAGVRRGRGARGPNVPRARREGPPLEGGMPSFAPNDLGVDGTGRRAKPRKNRQGKQTPFRKAPLRDAGARDLNGLRQDHSPTQGADLRRLGDESKSGQFAEALAASANVKRERLHKVMAQSGIGSRRDMEIMIASGRVMVNGIVATAGTQVAMGDTVLVDHRPIRLKFTQDLPRVLLYHKPDGEIVTTNDPGNRITVFDNLPRVENGKWIAVGRLDINTSGLLIFTTSGELANRFMHPRYEVEREYAVRILGELTDVQTKALLGGVEIGDSAGDDEDSRGNGNGDDEDSEDFDLPEYVSEDEFIPPVDEFEDELNDEVDGNAAPKSEPAVENAPPQAASRFDDEDEDDNRFNTIAPPVKFTPPVRKAPVQPLPQTALEKRDGLARFDVIEKRGGEGVNQWYHVVIREGRNREVRKMFESQGLTVSRLIRTRFGKIELPPRLLRGNMVELAPDQVRGVLASAGMETDGPIGKLPTHAPRPIHPGRNRDRAAQGAEGGGSGGGERAPRPPRDGERQRRRGKPGEGRGRVNPAGVANADNGGNEFEVPNAAGGFDAAAGATVNAEGVGEGGVRNKRRRTRGPRGEQRGGPRPPREAGSQHVAGEAAGSDQAASGGAGNVVQTEGTQAPNERGQERRPNPRGRRNFRGRNRRGGGRGGEGGGTGGEGGGSQSGGESQGNS